MSCRHPWTHAQASARRAFAIVFAVCIAFPTGALAGPSRTYPGPNGRLVFTSNIGGYSNLSVINPDGTGTLRITNTAANDTLAQFSPDGARIAFMRATPGSAPTWNLYVIGTDGIGETQVTTDGLEKYDLEWSPDGTKLVYTDAHNDIWVATLGSTSPVRIVAASTTTSPLRLHGTPTWSPDGTRIALTTLEWASGSDLKINVFVVNADGTALTDVTHAPYGELAGGPVWSPDGAYLAYARQSTPTASHPVQIHIVRPNGTGDVTLSTNPAVDETAIAWSANENRLLFSVRDRVTDLTSIWTMRPDGTGRMKVYDGTVESTSPVFSPDGKRILFRVPTGGSGLRSVALDGTSPQTITSYAVGAAHWGSYIVTCEQICEDDLFICLEWDAACWCSLDYKRCMDRCGIRVGGPTRCPGFPR